MEFSVALMLILLGVLNITGLINLVRARLGAAPDTALHSHSHAHAHGDYVHSHPHGHDTTDHGHAADRNPQARLDRVLGRLTLYQAVRPLVVGVVHGLAGSAAVALLVLATIRQPVWALLYLLLFGLGTVAGMMIITAAVGIPFAYTSARFVRMNRYLGVASGVVSLAFGLFLVYQIGFVDGLFTSNPTWTPE
jgi:high-affinity nickel-transport protein